MILIEMVHDARIVRLKGEGRNVEHPGPEVTKWLGDSIGWWEGDTLVVDTTNFPSRFGVARRLREDARRRTVHQATPTATCSTASRSRTSLTWTAPWTGEYLWQASNNRVYEYACHEGNYAMGNVLRGARLLEREALAEK